MNITSLECSTVSHQKVEHIHTTERMLLGFLSFDRHRANSPKWSRRQYSHSFVLAASVPRIILWMSTIGEGMPRVFGAP